MISVRAELVFHLHPSAYVNVASAQTISTGSPPLLSALAQSPSSAQGPVAQSTSLLDAFLPLLAALTAQSDQDGGVNIPAMGAGQQNKKGNKQENKKEDNKDALAALFTPVQVPQADAQRSLKLAFPQAASNAGGFSEPVTPANAAPPSETASAAEAISASPAIVNRTANESAGTASLPLESLDPTPPASPSFANTGAPIAFALRLDEAITGKAPAAQIMVSNPGASSADAPGISSEPPQPSLQQIPVQQIQAHQPRIQQPQVQQPEQPALQTETSSSTPATENAAPTASRRLDLSETPGPGAVQNASSQSALHPTDQKTDAPGPMIATNPNVDTTSDDRSAERTIQPVQSTKSQDEIRKPAHSQASASTDGGSTKHDDQATASIRAISSDVRTESDWTREADPQTVTRASAQPVTTPATQATDGSAALPSQPTREISMHLTPAASPSVDITLVDRAGSVHVAVRTADADLTRNLQSGLSDLVQRLEHKGFETEAWSPADSYSSKPAAAAQANGNDSAFQRNGRDPREGEQQGNSGQQNQGRNRPKWVLELEQRLAATEVG